jgi:hypothetical protein
MITNSGLFESVGHHQPVDPEDLKHPLLMQPRSEVSLNQAAVAVNLSGLSGQLTQTISALKTIANWLNFALFQLTSSIRIRSTRSINL